MPPKLGALRVVHDRQVVAVHQDPPSRGLRQPSDHVEEGRLATPGWAHDRHEFAWLHLEIDSAQRRDFHFPCVV